jgi:DUF2911 family protein
MVQRLVRFLPFLAAVALLAATPVLAQPAGITLPPSGDNQYASVTQGIGLVRVTIEYHSPDVHSPTGEDRHGKIWGGLVPYGLAHIDLATCSECPWRGGANENTVFRTTHDVKVQGQLLPAGSYGVHFIPGKDEWTIVFSKNSTAWGSYYYDPKDDALRVKAKPEKSEYHEWLTYEFIDRQTDHATAALKWEDLQLPFTISVDDIAGLYSDNLLRELKGEAGWDRDNVLAAAQYMLRNKKRLPEALAWVERVTGPGSGPVNFPALTALAALQEANGKTEEAHKTLDRALNLPNVTPVEIHQYGRQLQAQQKNEEAMRIFELNAKRFPDQWPVHVGLARGHAALGHSKEAVAEAREALKQAPDEPTRKAVEALIQQLEGAKGSK